MEFEQIYWWTEVSKYLTEYNKINLLKTSKILSKAHLNDYQFCQWLQSVLQASVTYNSETVGIVSLPEDTSARGFRIFFEDLNDEDGELLMAIDFVGYTDETDVIVWGKYDQQFSCILTYSVL